MFPHGPTVTRAHTHRHTVHICTQRYIYLLTVMNFCRGSVSRPHSSRLRRSRSSTACAARAVPGSSGPRLRTGPLRKAEQPRLGGASKGRWGTPPTGGLAAKSPSGELGGTKGRIAPHRKSIKSGFNWAPPPPPKSIKSGFNWALLCLGILNPESIKSGFNSF